MSEKVTLEAVEEILQLKTWWAFLAILPLANRIVVFIANRTQISPNTISFFALFFKLFSGICFLAGTWPLNCAAAGCYYLSYLLDCIDGPVARLTGQTSEFGRYLDHLSDLFGDIFILCCLLYSQGLLFSALAVAMVMLHLLESYISYLVGFVLNPEGGNEEKTFAAGKGLLSLYQRYRKFFHSRRMKSFVSFPDYECFIFILFPVAGIPQIGIWVCFFMLTIVVLYTVFSSFWAIHSGDGLFP